MSKEYEYFPVIKILGHLFDYYYQTDDPHLKTQLSEEISLLGFILDPASSAANQNN
ncbi:hypothetical protein [Heyndrickxia ginsengihumi]|uniref:hypothetical protein n=1 Tax=Heyndrickxia ginsengihumi TaxID=363870 RepID=UPI000AB9C29D|nr:hypothetical protein [Heyndrickxia ginsengihumi]